MLKHLDDLEIRKVETKVAKNNSSFLVFIKKSYDEIASDISIIDKWSKDVSIVDYDKVYQDDLKRTEVATTTNTSELSEDRIED